MEPRHRRSIRETSQIGWTVSDGREDPMTELRQQNEMSSSFVDTSGGGRIYPGLFAEEDDDDIVNGLVAGERNGSSQSINQNRVDPSGATCSSKSTTNTNTCTKSCWPPVNSVFVEEQPGDDAFMDQQSNEDDDEIGENVDRHEERPVRTMARNGDSMPVERVHNITHNVTSRRSLPASFQHQPQHLLRRWSPEQKQQEEEEESVRRSATKKHLNAVNDANLGTTTFKNRLPQQLANSDGVLDGDDDTGFWQFFESNFEHIFAARRFTWNANVLFPHQTLVFFLIGLLLLLVFVLPPLLSTLLFSSDAATVQQQQLSSADRLRMFRRELQQMLNQTNFTKIAPRTKYNMERTLNYLAEQMLRRRRHRLNSLTNGDGNNGDEIGAGTFGQFHPAPLVLLIASSSTASVDGRIGEGDAVADSISTQYTNLLTKHWPEYRLINVTAQPVHTKSDLSNLLMRSLLLSDHSLTAVVSSWWWLWPSMLKAQNGDDHNNDDTVLMLLNRIERLRGTAPLFLHSLADPESSPIVEAAGRHNVLIILTMITATPSAVPGTENNQQKSNDDLGNDGAVARDCEALIASSLLSNWQSDAVADDQIRPIVARISAIPLCVF